jgi:signal transduction histidine kinase
MSIDKPQTTTDTVQIDFATEVKADRLNILWRVTLSISVAIVLLMFAFVSSEDLSIEIWILAPITLIAFCSLTGVLLYREKYEIASMTFAIGGLVALSVAMFDGTSTAREILPFFFVLVVFIAGLMLRPYQTMLIAMATVVAIVGIPSFSDGELVLNGHQFMAILMIVISLLLSAQVTGELYQVTDWALMNYERERETNSALFDNRNELRRSLKRSEVLSEKLQESNAELEEARVSAEQAKNFRGQFLANMSHELRTPLNAIIGFSETMLKFPMMYDDQPLPEAYRKDLNQIYTSGQHLLSLINDILDLARVDAGKLEIYMEKVDLRPVVEAVIATSHGLVAGKPIELKTELPDELPDVWADANRVRQVLINLYSNAAKFTNEGSITLNIKETDAGVVFSVTDTGEGIPKDQIDLIFEEFTQSKSTGGRDPRAGSGLGLAISTQLLNLMNGRIWVESEVGVGSTFYFTLQPYNKDQNQTVETAAIEATPQNEEAAS